MIASPHRLLTLRRAASAVLASATLAGAVLASVSGLVACGSSTTTEGDDGETGKGDGSAGEGGVVVVTSDAGAIAKTKDAGPGLTDASTDATFDPFLVDSGPAINGYAASHPPFPTILNSGGKVLASPKFVLLSWEGYDYESEIEELMGRLGGSEYWTTVTGEYGVGPATYAGRISLGARALGSYNDADLQALLTGGKIAGLETLDSSTVYFFLVPKSSAVTFQQGVSCTDFAGYHWQTGNADGGASARTATYAVIAECGTFGPLKGVDVVTGTLSHESIEAVTDPLPQSAPAYQNPSDANLGWSTSAAGGELGDMCEVDPEAFFRSKEISLDAGGVGSVALQRSWSNAQAATGSDPCVPAFPDTAFFDSMPVENDVVPVKFSDSDKTFDLTGVDATSGSATIELDLFSDRPTADWQVFGLDLDGDANNTFLTFSFTGGTGGSVAGAATATGHNGTKLQMTITPSAQALASPGVYSFGVYSAIGPASDQLAHATFGIVAVGSP